jgi:hypothetical protein
MMAASAMKNSFAEFLTRFRARGDAEAGDLFRRFARR